MKKLNNKGYMLVEIVLASAIAFGIATYLINLTIKVKNKNDDLMVESSVKVDQGIIANMIMRDVYENDIHSCNKIKNKISYVTADTDNDTDTDSFTYTYSETETKTVYLSKYTVYKGIDCNTDDTSYDILTIYLSNTLDKNYDVKLYINKG